MFVRFVSEALKMYFVIYMNVFVCVNVICVSMYVCVCLYVCDFVSL